jgi:hypothetical protein
MAISTLRTIRRRPLRLTGDPANSARNAASSSADSRASSGASRPGAARSFGWVAAARAKRFHGQTARQSSQP